MNKIDIVIPWLNPTEQWYSQYKNYCGNENPARIRDLNTIRPAIKSILKNMPWVRYIWLIVFDEEQHANLDWEELKNDKVKFVYHRDIIPQEFLPNFNSMVTECFVNKIDGLAENFIWSNDDMIFAKPIPQEFFFKDNRPVHRSKYLYLYKNNNVCLYDDICETTANMIEKMFGKKILAQDWHMPIPLKKSLIDFLWTKYNDIIYNSCKNSKTRQKHNLAFNRIPFTIDEIKDLCIYQNLNIKTQPIFLSDNTTKQQIQIALQNNHIVCLNDGENLINKHKEIAEYIKESLENYF